MWWEKPMDKLIERCSVKTAATVWICWLVSDLTHRGLPVPQELWWAFFGAWAALFGLRVLKQYQNGKAK